MLDHHNHFGFVVTSKEDDNEIYVSPTYNISVTKSRRSMMRSVEFFEKFSNVRFQEREEI
jgi:hypothetical protein|tara:strand:- start:35 stop:214 length:180 start_codon:yes stop_codon:yes gene_type:complete